ncbi:unnamed protein product [Mycena citricolor]|uniref:Short-chain dehydrogenase n=1 Tax=Mycena citricolor TaxID=2018698 RepID=A0AAD2H1I0_9AGAR|nr:unnamed protein product [Mycena citricolor]
MYPTFDFNTTAEEVATAFAEQIKGKNVLITGTSLNSLGFETARVVAKYANLVIITGYNTERLKLARAELQKEGPHAEIRPLVIDLASLKDVRRAAAEVNAYAEPIHVLVNNAAAAVGDFKLSPEGYENQLATDHLGPFLFTALIAPKLLAARTETFTPRVIFVSSLAHLFGGVSLETWGKPDPASYDSMAAYAQAKTANILTAAELSRRAKGALKSYSLHPGIIFTNINQKEESAEKQKELGILLPDGSPNLEKYQWKSIPEGSATTVAAAFDPRLEDSPGAFLDDSKVANDKRSPQAADSALAARLWEITEELVGTPPFTSFGIFCLVGSTGRLSAAQAEAEDREPEHEAPQLGSIFREACECDWCKTELVLAIAPAEIPLRL